LFSPLSENRESLLLKFLSKSKSNVLHFLNLYVDIFIECSLVEIYGEKYNVCFLYVCIELIIVLQFDL